MKHVIIGASAAGLAAAKEIRKLAPRDEIVMISQDETIYSRCMLHKYISGERQEQELCFITGGFFEDWKITWLKGVTVTKIDTEKRMVYWADGETSYDKLLIATGADSVIPPIGELRAARNVYGLRHLSDAKAIRLAAENADQITIIGSGLVGLDAASALLEMGKKVTVIEMEQRILALQLDDKAASAYQKLFEDHGCVFKLGRKAEKTVSRPDGNISGIVLDNGEEIACDMVLVAAGVRPAIRFMEGSGIKTDRAVIVNDYLMSSCDGVYAAGDVNGLSGIWPNARKQGEIAGRNMCGCKEPYTDRFALKNTVNFFGLPTLSLGVFIPQEGDQVFIQEDQKRYNKIVLRDNVILGVIFQGDIANTGIWQELIKHKVDISKTKTSIWQLSFANFYGLKENGEYQWRK